MYVDALNELRDERKVIGSEKIRYGKVCMITLSYLMR